MELPEELIEKIARDHLEAYSQLVAFSSVCRSWRSIALRLHTRRRPCLPGLLVPKSITAASQSPIEEYYNNDIIHEFYPLATLCAATPSSPPIPHATLSFLPSPSKISDAMGQRNHYLHLHHNFMDKLAAPSSDEDDYDDEEDEDEDELWHHNMDTNHRSYELPAHCLGSKDGWILRTRPERDRYYCYRHRPRDLYLLNPITGASIPLCPLPAGYRQERIHRAIISSSPDDGECHVFVILSRFIAWCDVYSSSSSSRGVREAQGWKLIGNRDSGIFNDPEDAVYFDGKLYVAEKDRVLVFDHDLMKKMRTSFSSSSSSAVAATIVRSFPFSEAVKRKPYIHSHRLCHLNGQLLVILREWSDISFPVFKLLALPTTSQGGTCYCWEEVRSLDGHAVFLGAHESFSIRASADDGVRGDNIYFARGRSNGVIFDLVNKKTESFPDGHGESSHWRQEQPSFWFLPMIWDISKLHNKHHKKKKTAWEKGRLLGTGTATNYDDCNNNNETGPAGSEYCWTLPKKAIRSHEHQDDDNDKITHTNTFQALLLSDDVDPVGDDPKEEEA